MSAVDGRAPSSILDRRRFLALGAFASLGLAVGCKASTSATPAVGGDGQPATRDQLFGQQPFYVAHRGGGADWPEMTSYAYDQAARVPGLEALEVSVCATRDGVLVCNHDATTTRLCGVNYTIANETWQTLSGLMISAAYTKDPTQPARKITRLEEVLSAHGSTKVLYVEPKNPQAVEPLMAAMIAAGNPERVVWKQPINQPNFGRAKSQGFGTWGYVLNEPGHLGANLKRYAASATIDMLGAPRYEVDGFVTNVVQAARENQKRAMMWNIRSVADRARALSLGCDGLMTSDVTGVMSTPL